MRWFAFIALVASSIAFAESPNKVYPECAELKDKGTEAFEVCQSMAFSRQRLLTSTEENAYAVKAGVENTKANPAMQWYNAPSAEDGTTGATLLQCGKTQNDCVEKCRGRGECTQTCHQNFTTCAGTTTPGNSVTKAEPPDGYVIEFDDTAK